MKEVIWNNYFPVVLGKCLDLSRNTIFNRGKKETTIFLLFWGSAEPYVETQFPIVCMKPSLDFTDHSLATLRNDVARPQRKKYSASFLPLYFPYHYVCKRIHPGHWNSFAYIMIMKISIPV